MNKIVPILVLGILVLSSVGMAAVNNNNAISDNTTADNHPPDTPKITGPKYTRPGPHIWAFKAIDPDGDNISYEIDWGDGITEKWIGPYASGEEVTRTHSYSVKMTASIRARANDTHGAIGEWGYLLVVISESSQQFINNQIQPNSLLLQQISQNLQISQLLLNLILRHQMTSR